MPYIKEDKQKLSQLYTALANQVISELPKGWSNLCLGYFADTSDRENMLIYVSEDEGKSWRDFMDDVFDSDEVMFGIFDAKDTCREIRELCSRMGDKWTRFTFTVNRLGEFSADFKYEEYDEISDYYKKMWLGDYLG